MTHEIATDPLAKFRQISGQCSESECRELIASCEESPDPTISGPVRDLYAKRLKFLEKRRIETEHYERQYGS